MGAGENAYKTKIMRAIPRAVKGTMRLSIVATNLVKAPSEKKYGKFAMMKKITT